VSAERVLLVLSNLDAGGAERQVMLLARGLAARGRDVTIVALGHVRTPVEPVLEAGARILALGADGPRARVAALPTLMRLARRADVVVCTNWDASLYGRVAALAVHRPVVVADHFNERAAHTSRRGAPRGRWVAAHHRLLAPFTVATVACARAQLPVLLAEGVPAGRLAHIPNGIDVEEVRSAAARGPARSALGLPSDALVIVHAANFRPEKNQPQTLETVADLRRTLGDVHAVFVGGGPQEAAVRERARALGAGWAHFLGTRADVPGVLALADLVVLPSRAEAMPLTVLEAQVAGVPVVACDVGDVRAMLDATGGGLVVPAGDGPAFTAACRQLLADPALRARLARAAREGSAAYDAAAMTRRYAELLDAAAPRRRPPRVVHVGPDIAGRGGMPTVLRELFASPIARTYQFEFIATYGSATYAPVDRVQRAVTFARGLARLVRWMLGPGPRLVHVHTATRGSWYRKACCVLAARALRRPVILHVHAGAGDVAAFCERVGPVRRRWFGACFRAADRVLSVSGATAGEIERRLGVPGIETLPTPAPLRRATSNGHAHAGNGRERVDVLYLGGFANPAKGGRVLVEALPALRRSAPQVRVSMAGLGPAPHDAAAGARWLGWLEPDRAAAALEEADIVVLPSISEGLPLVLLQALAAQKAVVATSVGGLPEVLTDGVDGVLVPPADPDALARGIAALASDADRRSRIARAGRARAERLGDDEAHRRLDAIYRELLRGRGERLTL
jgi:glycosyltransferase involved in cell wall biosynthesis